MNQYKLDDVFVLEVPADLYDDPSTESVRGWQREFVFARENGFFFMPPPGCRVVRVGKVTDWLGWMLFGWGVGVVFTLLGGWVAFGLFR